MSTILSLTRTLAVLIVSPLLFLTALSALAISDLFFLFRKRRPVISDSRPDNSAATIVIPNWNGRDLLAKYLPPLLDATADNARNEILVVDNGSDDGSVEFLREHFPGVRVLALDRNLGFGAGSNAGFHAATNDIVVLLNSDMRVARDFLSPLLETFRDDRVFAVSCQIFFNDPNKPREETGLTQGWWENGQLRVRHRIDDAITEAFPCFYGGGGSCAFDRRKFLELGEFDDLLAPFYLEDTDLGYLAWKRGWKVLYQPKSHVWHEHRGTIGKTFRPEYIASVLRKNYLLWCWKNVHDWRMLLEHFAATFGACIFSSAFGHAPLRPNFDGFLSALRQLPGSMRSRLRARDLAVVSDTEAFRRHMGGYFRDRFEPMPVQPDRLSVLFVSPYGMYPPVHGGGVFMYQTVRELARRTDLHLIVMLDWPHEYEPHQPIRDIVSSVEFIIRTNYAKNKERSIQPHAVAEFRNADFEWLIHRQIYTKRIDVVQLEYTPLAQYAAQFRKIPSIVFEHDVYFQSIARGLRYVRKAVPRWHALFEYLRALRYEAVQLQRADRIQVCSRENREYLESFFPSLRGRIDDGFRAGIDTSLYNFRIDGREPRTMLFLGSFRHTPNQEALEWFTRLVLPRIVERMPEAHLKVVGAEPPALHSLPENTAAHLDLVGFVENAREPLGRYAVFVCPILSGSGVRVKLLEAFASGIPVVSTRLGAEGLAVIDGEICALADDPADFAQRVLELLENASQAQSLAQRARDFVVREKDIGAMTCRLVENYRETVGRMRSANPAPPAASDQFQPEREQPA